MTEWDTYVSDEEENAAGYAEGLYTFTHCAIDGCHNLFPHGKNGGECLSCNEIVCEEHCLVCDGCGESYCQPCASEPPNKIDVCGDVVDMICGDCAAEYDD